VGAHSIEPVTVRACESTTAVTSLSKRILDIIVCLIIVIIFAPVIALLIVLVMQDGGPAFYAQKRVGQNGVTFRCWKFRTMVEDADQVLRRLLATDSEKRQEYERYWKLREDPRVTLTGKFLRRTSLDELPQIFNVLRGDMSLVGPRPRSTKEMRFFDSAMPEFNRAYESVKPGLTGLWQISGRNRLTLQEKGELDARYAKNWSFRSDLAIILATVPIILSGDGAF
jgi:exopolysaccharide production protein ExoY